jgi:tetratricopeptide (TPR) repeat protein
MPEKKQLLLEFETIATQASHGSPPSTTVALELLKTAKGDVRLTAIACVILGHAWQHISAHHKARMAFSSAAEGFKQIQAPHHETEALIWLGMSHLLSGEPLRALDCWSQALVIARKINDRDLCTRVYLGVGQVYIGFGDYQAALGFNELALEMARRLNHDERKGEALLNVASDAYRLGRYNYTLQCVAEAEKLLNTTISNKVWSAEVVYFRGLVHCAQGHFLQAKLELETAFQLSDQNDNLWGKAHALVALGETLLKTDEPTAGEVLERAHGLASSGQMQALMRRASLALIEWHERHANLAATLPHYNLVLHEAAETSISLPAAHLNKIQTLLARSRMRLLETQLGS